LRTNTQVKALHAIKNEFSFFKDQLTLDFNKIASTYTEVQKKCHHEVASIESIKDIVFNIKTNDVLVEKDKVGISEYKYLFIENHQIVSEKFNRFAKNVFRTLPQNSHVWFSVEFEYELKKPRENDLGQKEFILVNDRKTLSVLDNWFFCRTNNYILSVEQWVPFNQFKNSDFQKFVIERLEKTIRERIDLIQINKVKDFFINSTPGFTLKKGRLRNSKLSTQMPSFNFWSQEKINRYLFTKYDLKMRELNKPVELKEIKG
jgi:hypothetical protein